jgi:putative hydrolase of the HAD superfamily
MDKVILFDLDGVLALPEEAFSIIYTKSRGYDIKPFIHFFENEWVNFVTGRADIKQHITENPNFWKWDGTPDELLSFWFKAEDVKNDPLLDIIHSARKDGFKCYVATEQEKYRTGYIRDVMFGNEFDGVFSTAEIGYRKNDPKFYEAILESLNIPPSQVAFFDDSQSKIDTALKSGINAQLYQDVEQVRSFVSSSE